MIKQLYLLGAGEFVWNILKWAKAEGITGIAITDHNQGSKTINATGKSFISSLADYQIDCMVVEKAEDIAIPTPSDTNLYISYGAPWIIPQSVIAKTFQNRLLNIHGTRLPRERGGTIFSWQILTGQRTGMCLIHQMTEKIDEGPIIAWDEFIYPPHCKIPADYIHYYEEQNARFIKSFIQQYNGINTMSAGQPEYLSTYWPRLMANVHGWINWENTALEIERHICAFDEPYGGARCRWNNQEIILRNTHSQAADGYTHPFQRGLIYRNNGKWINVASKEGELLICSVQDLQGNNIIHKLKPGERLYCLPEDQVTAYQRVKKTKTGLELQFINKTN